MAQMHEDLGRKDTLAPRAGSERSFGVVFSVVFLVIGLYPLVHAARPHWWAVTTGAIVAIFALVAPTVFRLPNRIWFLFGNGLAAVVGPVALAVVYALAIVPTGFLMKMVGKDPLRLRFDRDLRSYWIDREPPGPEPKTLNKQF